MRTTFTSVIFFIFTATTPLISYAFEFTPVGYCDQLIEYTYYQTCYSEEHRQAFWTSHLLTRESILGDEKRARRFYADYSLDDPVEPYDYKYSGFDRGHLVPAADMKLNKDSMSESFMMTNVSPQRSGFNSGIWRVLENGFRKEVLENGDAYIITAPVLSDEYGYEQIESGVSIPDYFYKIAYFPEKELMIAYLIPNVKLSGHKYWEFEVSVDEIEELTGYDFFEELPDDLENELEAY